MDENRIKHMELIQSVITRQAANSFAVKGWSVVIVAALLALSANDSERLFAVVALLPAICFWGLDAYYLRQERLFRALFDAVRTEAQPADFSMNTKPVSNGIQGITKTALWPGVTPVFHLPVLAAPVVVLILLAVAASKEC